MPWSWWTTRSPTFRSRKSERKLRARRAPRRAVQVDLLGEDVAVGEDAQARLGELEARARARPRAPPRGSPLADGRPSSRSTSRRRSARPGVPRKSTRAARECRAGRRRRRRSRRSGARGGGQRAGPVLGVDLAEVQGGRCASRSASASAGPAPRRARGPARRRGARVPRARARGTPRASSSTASGSSTATARRSGAPRAAPWPPARAGAARPLVRQPGRARVSPGGRADRGRPGTVGQQALERPPAPSGARKHRRGQHLEPGTGAPEVRCVSGSKTRRLSIGVAEELDAHGASRSGGKRSRMPPRRPPGQAR